MENRYICKIASAEEMEQKWDYEIGIHAEKENWIAWKSEAIEGARSGRSVPYYGILDGTVICEATAIPNPGLKHKGIAEATGGLGGDTYQITIQVLADTSAQTIKKLTDAVTEGITRAQNSKTRAIGG